MRARRRTTVVALVAAAATGFGGAAAVTALAEPSVPVAHGYGPGDGLTRYVVAAHSGPVDPQLLGRLSAAPGVDNAQRLVDGTALVATRGLSPADLERVPGVGAVTPSTTVPVAGGTVTDPYWQSYGWNLDNTGGNAYAQTAVADADTDAPDAWPSGTGQGMVVAVVDTGYYSAHEDLAGALWTNPREACGTVDTDGDGLVGDCHGWNFTTNTPDVDNGAGGSHGTAVSGTIAARAGNGLGSAGVAPGVQIMPLAVGSGEGIDVNLATQAIRYAVDHGANVINGSWGGSMAGPALDNLRAAIAYAGAHGVPFVVAAGNDSQNRDTSPSYPASLTDDDVITVGSSTAADTISDFSAYGATSVDLFAPGSKVFVPWNNGGYSIVDGTSFSSPETAAVVALYRAAMPTATAQQLKQALLADTDKVPAFAGRSVSGGRLSASRVALSAVGGVRLSFAGMTAPAGTVTPRITVSTPPQVGTYSVRLGLGMEDGGEIWALSGKPVTLAQATGGTVPTDDTGTALFTLGSRTGLDGTTLTPSADLQAGRYVLTVQLYVDGTALGRTFAAPLLVGQTASAGGSTGSGSTGSGSTGSGSTGSGSTGSGSTGSGGSTGGGTTTPGTRPGGSTGSGSTGSGSTGSGSTGPGSTGSGSTGSGSTGSGSTGSGSTGSGSGSTGSGTAPAPGTGSRSYPAVGAFRITGISPTVVSTAGGMAVVITGQALPASPVVRIGSTAVATTVSSSATLLAVRVPARVAGVYDVTVLAPDGTSTVLTAALTYVDAVGSPGSGSSGGTGTGTGSGSTGGGTGSGGTGSGSTGSGSTGSGGTGSGGTGSGSTGSGSGGTGTGTTSPAVRAGAHGERLVHSDVFAALGWIWTVDCSASCSGVGI